MRRALGPKRGAWCSRRKSMRAGDNPRFVVTSLDTPTPARLSEDLSCVRGKGAQAIKAVQVDLRRDRTSATTFLANTLRVLLACAADVLHHALRTSTVHHPALAPAQPSTIIVTLCKIAAQITQSKDRILLHLPSACPVQTLLHRVTAWLYVVLLPVGNTS